MSTSLAPGEALADVIRFPSSRRQPRTLIFRATMQQPSDVYRHVGVNDALPLSELHRVLSISFGLGEKQTPWAFYADGSQVDMHACVHQYLTEPGQRLVYRWGLWSITLEAIDSYMRDGGTPEALCIGGAGELGNSEFSVAKINAQLTGADTIAAILQSVRPAVRDLIERSRLYDFVALLQAMELSRPGLLDEAMLAARQSLPVESDQAAKDAFWCCVLALSTLADAAVGGSIIEETMTALGWLDENGEELSASAIRGMCAESLQQLAALGGYGRQALAPVDRLDFYRALLRA